MKNKTKRHEWRKNTKQYKMTKRKMFTYDSMIQVALDSHQLHPRTFVQSPEVVEAEQRVSTAH
jgi:hypothetical protein